MNSEVRETVIGAGAVLGLALVLGYLYGGRDLAVTAATGDVLVTARFNQVDGLAEGDDVRLGGIKIGTIGGMALDDQYRAVITLRIAGDVPLPTDTSAAIHTDGLFGSKFMVLEPGAEEEMLKSGDEITFTQGSVIVSDLLELVISEGRAALKRRQNEGKEDKEGK